MTEEEKEKIKEVNLGKAKNNLKWPIIIMIILVILEAIPMLGKKFNIAVVFSTIALAFLAVGRIFIGRKEEIKAKLFITYSIIPIVITIICELINDIKYYIEHRNSYSEEMSYFDIEIVAIACILSIIKVIRNLSKANDPITYKESTDWFYERYNENDKNR